MYLDEVSRSISEMPAFAVPRRDTQGSALWSKWADWPASQISHHGEDCCSMAEEWIKAMDVSLLAGASVLTGPRWLRQQFKWGASTFPIYWCEAVRRDTLDCGALAAMSDVIFTSRGVECYRVQMVQRFSEIATRQWEYSWNDDKTPLAWVSGDLIYHEGSAVAVGPGEIKVWDTSAGWWIDPRVQNGYGSLLALRVSPKALPNERSLKWGEHIIPAGEWKALGTSNSHAAKR